MWKEKMEDSKFDCTEIVEEYSIGQKENSLFQVSHEQDK